MKKLLSLCLLLFITGCATPTTLAPQGSNAEVNQEARRQAELALERNLQEHQRVNDVAFPLLKKNADLCPETQLMAGFTVWNDYGLTGAYKDVANIKYGLGEVAQIQSVFKKSPAQKSGIRPGDKVIAINDVEIIHGRNSTETIYKALDNAEAPIVKLTLNRNGEEFSKDIERVKVCGYGIAYNPADLSINAYADGQTVFIPRGMLRFIEHDNELALVIAHELGHNAMGHSDKKRANATMAGIGGLALDVLAAAGGVNTQGAFTDAAAKAGAGAYSVEFEQEADYVGMYFLERAGYKTANAANFWRRMATEIDSSAIKEQTTHPATAERFVAIDKAYQEVQKKKKSGKALQPEIDLERVKKYQPKESNGFND